MNIVVCVKLVPDTHIPLEIDPQTGMLNNDDLVYVINPCDRTAVEEAVRLKEEGWATQITLVCLGSPAAVRGLRSCLALGADRAILLDDAAFAGSDSYAAAVVLAKAIASLSYDLILCGTRATDTNTGLVGPVVAEILRIPLVTEVAGIAATVDSKVTVQRKLEKGDREVVEVRLPALLTVDIEVEVARYASLPALMAAQEKQIEQLDIKALGLSSAELGASGARAQILKFTPPKPRRKKLFTPEASLSATAKISMLMAGGITEKKTEFLEGEPKKIAATLVQFLTQQKLLKTDSTETEEKRES
ncbi:electron transfer flavoprotein subunit beta/FixA family protein [Chloroflexota bacterium]